MNELILAHGGAAGLAIEASIIIVPLVILFFLLTRSGSSRDEDE
jgi:hypothetical protein